MFVVSWPTNFKVTVIYKYMYLVIACLFFLKFDLNQMSKNDR